MRVPFNGYVVADDDAFFYRWFGYSCICPADLRAAIEKNPAGEELVLEVNSPGGDVMAGNEMYSILRTLQGVDAVAEVQSLAASAMSYAILGCRRVMMSPVAQMMIHLPAVVSDGNYHDHQHSALVLKSIGESILNAYEVRCAGRTDRKTLQQMMEKETWMPAQDAVAAGLADGILYQEGETPLTIPGSITNALGGGIRALALSAGCMPSAAELRDKYQRLGLTSPANGDPAASPAFPAEKALKDDWRNSARLSIAKAKNF